MTLDFFTAEGGVLFEVLSADVDIFHQALSSVCPPLLYGVLGTQSEHGHVFQRQTEATQSPVQLLGETLPHLVALILVKGQEESCDEPRKLCAIKSDGQAPTLMTREHSWYCSSVMISW